jgi:hypothetical protein
MMEFIKRHKGLVIGGAVALAGGILGTLFMSKKTEEECDEEANTVEVEGDEIGSEETEC